MNPTCRIRSEALAFICPSSFWRCSCSCCLLLVLLSCYISPSMMCSCVSCSSSGIAIVTSLLSVTPVLSTVTPVISHVLSNVLYLFSHSCKIECDVDLYVRLFCFVLCICYRIFVVLLVIVCHRNRSLIFFVVVWFVVIICYDFSIFLIEC